jgi:arabinofuranosyltransferase
MSRRVVLGASALLAAATIVFGAMRAFGAAWLSDDSFISFRYAQQLVHGNGLVYNAGERVEAYTNLLWTLLLAAAMRIGIRPEISAHVLGLGFWLALIGLLALVSYRRARSQSFAPLAATLVLLMDDYQTWATGGLETSMFAFLSVAGLLLASASHARPCRMLLAGLLLLAAVGTRPDGVIFAAVAVAGVWLVNENVSPRARLALTAALAAPLMLGGALLAAFKLLYYGDLFPTAFYSKSALDPYYSQGLFYIYLFFKKNWFLCPLVIGLITLALAQRVRPSQLLNRRHLVLLAAFVAFVAYVAHSGGDFMFARRLIPAMPLLFIVLEGWLVTIPGRTVKVGVLALLLLGVSLPYPIYPNPTERIRGIANEPAYYTQSYVEMRHAQGAVAARVLGRAPVRAIFEGGMCMFGYYSGLPYLVEMTGLTQYSLAKMPLTVRGQVGHEKVADARWMTEHGIHFVFAQEPPSPRSELRVDEIVFDGILKARIWIYVDAIMDPLRSNPDVRFLPIEGTLREAGRHIEGASHAEAHRIYDVLQRYYFQTAGPEKKPLADALWRQVEARRAS